VRPLLLIVLLAVGGIAVGGIAVGIAAGTISSDGCDPKPRSLLHQLLYLQAHRLEHRL
jgi:hypothetical protein